MSYDIAIMKKVNVILAISLEFVIESLQQTLIF